MNKILGFFTIILFSSVICLADGFNGRWTLSSPSGGAVWLKVEEDDNGIRGWMMWEIGNVYQIKNIHREQDALIITQPCFRWYMTRSGMKRDQIGEDALRAVIDGDAMTIYLDRKLTDGSKLPTAVMKGRRAAPLPPAPDLKSLKFAAPIELFNGVNLDGWTLTNPADNNAWSVGDGILSNNPELEDGADARQFGNIRSVAEFQDFRLQLEVRLPRGGNSGIYLRGRYEVQVTDSYGKKSVTGLGSIYSRLPALVNAARPAGEWQKFDIILAQQHVTVTLNDTLVVDNQPLEGCTGGALNADDALPGPIYFQGDHTAVEYRNIILTPIIE